MFCIYVLLYDINLSCWDINKSLKSFERIMFQKGCLSRDSMGISSTKLIRVKGAEKFISSGSKIVTRLQRRQYDPVIVEWTISIVFYLSTVLFRSVLKRFYIRLTNLLDRDWALLLVLSDCLSDSFNPWTWVRFQVGDAQPSECH